MAEETTDNPTSTPVSQESMQEFVTSLKSLEGELRTLNTHVNNAKAQPETTEPEEEEDTGITGQEVDIDSLTNKELAALISDSILTNAEKRLFKPMMDKINELENKLTVKEATTEIEQVAAANPDFKEWIPEMKAITAKAPALSIKEAYVMAKGLNPAKAEELQAKYNSKPKEERRTPFGGLTPTKGGKNSTTHKAMSKTDALEAAWNKVSSTHGPILDKYFGE
jgi:hypothetical protein